MAPQERLAKRKEKAIPVLTELWNLVELTK